MIITKQSINRYNRKAAGLDHYSMEVLFNRLEKMYNAMKALNIAPSLSEYVDRYCFAIAVQINQNEETLKNNPHFDDFRYSTRLIDRLYPWVINNNEARATDPSLQSLYDLLLSLMDWKDKYDTEGDAAKLHLVSMRKARWLPIIYNYETKRKIAELYTTPFLRFLRVFVHNEIIIKDKGLISFWRKRYQHSAQELLGSILEYPKQLNDPEIREQAIPELPFQFQAAYEKASLLFKNDNLKWGGEQTLNRR